MIRSLGVDRERSIFVVPWYPPTFYSFLPSFLPSFFFLLLFYYYFLFFYVPCPAGRSLKKSITLFLHSFSPPFFVCVRFELKEEKDPHQIKKKRRKSASSLAIFSSSDDIRLPPHLFFSQAMIWQEREETCNHIIYRTRPVSIDRNLIHPSYISGSRRLLILFTRLLIYFHIARNVKEDVRGQSFVATQVV